MQREFELEAIYGCLSKARLGKYKKFNIEPIAVYQWNVALSESLYPLLHVIEVSLRNRLHKEIGILLQDEAWLINKQPDLFRFFNPRVKKEIADNKGKLKDRDKLDEDHLIAELNFGFWTMLLSGPFEADNFLWPRLKNKVFPNAHGIKIKTIRDRLDRIRRLRNRIFHYETIWHHKDLPLQHDRVRDAIEWIEPSLLRLIQIDRFHKVYQGGPNA